LLEGQAAEAEEDFKECLRLDIGLKQELDKQIERIKRNLATQAK
jgi:hypothetical protein